MLIPARAWFFTRERNLTARVYGNYEDEMDVKVLQNMKIYVSGRQFCLDILTVETAARDRLDASASEIVSLFLSREKSFGFGSNIVVDYPDIGPDSRFLGDPVAYLEERLASAALAETPFGQVVILTTYADRIGRPLIDMGCVPAPIDMPAGPDNTCALTYQVPNHSAAARVLYVEAVNEADPKIRPSFVLSLVDEDRLLVGGACGAIHSLEGRRYAYLAMMAVAPGLPPTTGTRLAEAMLDLLRRERVSGVNLGTQTAGPFYEKLGFDTTHRLVRGLRHRIAEDGRRFEYDLVMMTLNLDPTDLR